MYRFAVVFVLATLLHFGIVGGWVAAMCGAVVFGIVIAALFEDNPLGRIAFRIRRPGRSYLNNYREIDFLRRGDGGIDNYLRRRR